MTDITCLTPTAPVAKAARTLSAEDVLRDVAFALKMARKCSTEIRREATVKTRRPRPANRVPAMA